jgi:hypothetical protein
MLTRTLSVLATLLVAAAALAAVPASATEAPPPPSQAQPQACLDSSRPTSSLHKQWQKGFRNRVIRGTASDQGCGASGAGKVKSVRVSIARRVGNQCQHVMKNGRLGKKTDCAPRWLVAKGTSNWALRLKKKLPAGRYTVRTSAVDSAGNIQK